MGTFFDTGSSFLDNVGDFGITAGGAAAGSVAGDILGNVIGSYFGGKNEKRSNRRTESMSARSKALDWQYKQAELDKVFRMSKVAYDYSNQENYKYNRDYAQNSASWAIDGLRKAGLNPILAASNLGSTLGIGGSSAQLNAPSGASSGSTLSSAGSRSSVPLDLLEGMVDYANSANAFASAGRNRAETATTDKMRNSAVETSQAQAESAKVDVGIRKKEMDLRDAEIERVKAQADEARSSTAKNLADAIDIENGRNFTADVSVGGKKGFRVGGNFPARIMQGLMPQSVLDSQRKKYYDSFGIRHMHESSAKQAQETDKYLRTYDNLKLGREYPVRKPSARRHGNRISLPNRRSLFVK